MCRINHREMHRQKIIPAQCPSTRRCLWQWLGTISGARGPGSLQTGHVERPNLGLPYTHLTACWAVWRMSSHVPVCPLLWAGTPPIPGCSELPQHSFASASCLSSSLSCPQDWCLCAKHTPTSLKTAPTAPHLWFSYLFRALLPAQLMGFDSLAGRLSGF